MSSSHARLAILLSTALLALPVFATDIHRSPTSGGASPVHKSTTRSRHRARRHRGQQAIQADRVIQIQQALIRVHYLSGEANGKWDATTIDAMRKYQADHGWQTKLTPDSRALKNLGLGPDYSGAINAQSANVSAPPPSNSANASQTAGFVAASGVNQ